MAWCVNIKYANNGFIVKYKGGDTEGEQVYQQKDDPSLQGPEENKEHLVDLFWDIMDYFGMSGSKHDKKRLRITYEEQK